jgi:hypothetical protein
MVPKEEGRGQCVCKSSRKVVKSSNQLMDDEKGGNLAEFYQTYIRVYGRKVDEENFGNEFRTFCFGSLQRYVHVLFSI